MALLRTSTKSELIRYAAKILGKHQSNKVIKDYILESTTEYDSKGRVIKPGVNVSVVQICQVLGIYAERKLNIDNELHVICKQFIRACNNDIRLARRILREYEVSI